MGVLDDWHDHCYGPRPKPRWHWGVICRLGSAWVGVHYSPYNKRVCINVVPCVTLWVTAPGGNIPDKMTK